MISIRTITLLAFALLIVGQPTMSHGADASGRLSSAARWEAAAGTGPLV
jgi:hypothetical protein